MDVVGSIQYTKIKQIGIGSGMNSEVYLVNDPQLGGTVAAKEIEKSKFPNPAAYFQEAQAMFGTAHDNVVAIQYACQTATTISLIMPFYFRGSLKDRIENQPLQISEALRIAQGVLAGLAHIHLKGYIHFDLKPSNVLFSDRDVPMVADFGQSRSISPTGVVSVPPLYIYAQPPETISTGVATSVADIYHFGLLMYRALNGDQFYTSQIPSDLASLKTKILAGKFPDRARFMPHVPTRVRTLVRKALSLDAADRFQSATEMADALSRVKLELDWSTVPLGAGGFRWKAVRPAQADLIVELINQGGSWDVKTYTQTQSMPPRTKGKSENWRSGLTTKVAYEHLKDVFERMLP